MRATGKAGMTDEQIADFVSRFMPAYKVPAAAIAIDQTAIIRPSCIHLLLC